MPVTLEPGEVRAAVAAMAFATRRLLRVGLGDRGIPGVTWLRAVPAEVGHPGEQASRFARHVTAVGQLHAALGGQAIADVDIDAIDLADALHLLGEHVDLGHEGDAHLPGEPYRRLEAKVMAALPPEERERRA